MACLSFRFSSASTRAVDQSNSISDPPGFDPLRHQWPPGATCTRWGLEDHRWNHHLKMPMFHVFDHKFMNYLSLFHITSHWWSDTPGWSCSALLTLFATWLCVFLHPSATSFFWNRCHPDVNCNRITNYKKKSCVIQVIQAGIRIILLCKEYFCLWNRTTVLKTFLYSTNSIATFNDLNLKRPSLPLRVQGSCRWTKHEACRISNIFKPYHFVCTLELSSIQSTLLTSCTLPPWQTSRLPNDGPKQGHFKS